ncbi:hypothetical protein [Caulobacter sp. RHG1]|uniref:hypothetical protein n=1 Tax=Caulobacter sp. (strain RHG1) TaxID=2545762 RepID=UPI0015543C31|nr:hypothetical protein [Caulobacter sp. RHG1]NQE62833.1 hypothetical protein [Caulobacter sp. RHG1]
MRRLLLLGLVAAGLSACSPKLPESVDESVLVDAIGRSIGSPSTCVVIGDEKGRLVWRAGGYVTCARNLPTCDGAEATAEALLKSSAGRPARFFSCPNPAVAANTVGWAIGPVPTSEGKPHHTLTYVAVMEGDKALPGLEIQDRVERAFKKGGF